MNTASLIQIILQKPPGVVHRARRASLCRGARPTCLALAASLLLALSPTQGCPQPAPWPHWPGCQELSSSSARALCSSSPLRLPGICCRPWCAYARRQRGQGTHLVHGPCGARFSFKLLLAPLCGPAVMTPRPTRTTTTPATLSCSCARTPSSRPCCLPDSLTWKSLKVALSCRFAL